jgi:hypothetical protein
MSDAKTLIAGAPGTAVCAASSLASLLASPDADVDHY